MKQAPPIAEIDRPNPKIEPMSYTDPQLVEQRCRRVHIAGTFWRLGPHAIEFTASQSVMPARAPA
jgi:hypothetical protein